MMNYDLAIIGSGPGGYIAAIYASRHKLKVCLIEEAAVGGTCLNRGCIPTKTLLNSARILSEIKDSGKKKSAISLTRETRLPRAHKSKVLDSMHLYIPVRRISDVFKQAGIIVCEYANTHHTREVLNELPSREVAKVIDFIHKQVKQHLNRSLKVFSYSNKAGFESQRQTVYEFILKSIAEDRLQKSKPR